MVKLNILAQITFGVSLLGLTSATKVGIEVLKAVPESECVKAENGDFISVHYAGSLEDGSEFDNSFKRGEPISFQLGSGQVITGWEQGLLDTCIGEKRKLTIPPELGYGSRGIGPIPGGATLIFETELVSIRNKQAPARDEL